MAKKTDADIVVGAISEHAASTEIIKRDQVQNVEQAHHEEKIAIREIYELAGKIKAMKFQKSQSDFFGILMLKQVKDAKEYRDRFGMSWESFCEYVGVSRRWVDEQLADLKPFKVEFLEAFLRFSGVPINKVKYLGDAISGGNSGISENSIIYNDEIIPIDAEHQDDIKALFETLEENHKKEKEETETTIRTKDRLLKAKEDTINKMERELKRLERTVDKSELTEEEQDAVNLLAQVQKDFLAAFSDIKKKIKPHEAPEVALRQYYFLLLFMAKVTMEERLALHEAYANAEECPWEITEMELPSSDVMIDNLPMSAGKGMGKKVAEKIEERKAKNGKK